MRAFRLNGTNGMIRSFARALALGAGLSVFSTGAPAQSVPGNFSANTSFKIWLVDKLLIINVN